MESNTFNWKDYTDVDLKANEVQNYIRKNGCPDYIRVDGILYTMEEYDEAGKYIWYANKKHEMKIEVRTSDRYSDSKLSDAEIEISDSGCYRNDIVYAE